MRRPGKKLSAGLLSLLAVWIRLLKVFTLLKWKNDVQVDDSSLLQGRLGCPNVEARGRGDLSCDASEVCRFKAGVSGTSRTVADRWWLVAGLRSVGICPLESRLAKMLSLVVPIRLINLLGYAEELADVVGENVGVSGICE